MPQRIKRVTVYIPEDQYRGLRAKLASLGLSVSEWFRKKAKEETDK